MLKCWLADDTNRREVDEPERAIDDLRFPCKRSFGRCLGIITWGGCASLSGLEQKFHANVRTAGDQPYRTHPMWYGNYHLYRFELPRIETTNQAIRIHDLCTVDRRNNVY